jgi:hypothetical protein
MLALGGYYCSFVEFGDAVGFYAEVCRSMMATLAL